MRSVHVGTQARGSLSPRVVRAGARDGQASCSLSESCSARTPSAPGMEARSRPPTSQNEARAARDRTEKLWGHRALGQACGGGWGARGGQSRGGPVPSPPPGLLAARDPDGLRKTQSSARSLRQGQRRPAALRRMTAAGNPSCHNPHRHPPDPASGQHGSDRGGEGPL